MNILKRFTSFATDSFRLFLSEDDKSHHHHQRDQSYIIDNVTNEDGSATNQAIVVDDVDNPAANKNSEEFDREYEEQFQIRKSLTNLLLMKKQRRGWRPKNRKITKTVIMSDPRSPTNDFARTPIIVEKIEYNDVLSPFNVTEMLDTIESAIECTEQTLIDDNGEEIDVNNDEEAEALISNEVLPSMDDEIKPSAVESQNCNLNTDQEAKAVEDLNENIEKIMNLNEMYDWNQLTKYNSDDNACNDNIVDKPLSDSLIVETSQSTILDDPAPTSITITNQDDMPSKSVSVSPVNENDENDAQNSKIEQENENNCKIIGYSMKTQINDMNPLKFKASTPKKTLEKSQKPRTPLMSINNSPLMVKSQQKLIKKRVTKPQHQRRLPRKPSTPLNNRVLVNNNNNLITFDKENY